MLAVNQALFEILKDFQAFSLPKSNILVQNPGLFLCRNAVFQVDLSHINLKVLRVLHFVIQHLGALQFY